MSNTAACPQCTLENIYLDGSNFVCADCGFEWPQAQTAATDDEDDAVVKDSNGQVLQDGDAVVLIKDLKVKGSSTVLKMGTKVKSIRLVGGDHEVDCKSLFPQESLTSRAANREPAERPLAPFGIGQYPGLFGVGAHHLPRLGQRSRGAAPVDFGRLVADAGKAMAPGPMGHGQAAGVFAGLCGSGTVGAPDVWQEYARQTRH